MASAEYNGWILSDTQSSPNDMSICPIQFKFIANLHKIKSSKIFT